MHLMPLYLYSAERRGDLETLKRQNVLDCVECGSSAYTCPGLLAFGSQHPHRQAEAAGRCATQAGPCAGQPVRRANHAE